MATVNISEKIDTFINDKYIPLEKKIKILLAVLVVLLPVVVFYFLFFSPNLKKIQGLEVKKTALTAEVQRAKKAALNLKKYKAELEEANKRFTQTAIVLPKMKEIPELLRNISDLGKGAGLDFLSFKPGKETPKDFYAEIPVDISIRGPYHNMGYFLDQISKLDRIVTVDNIKMSSPQKEGGEILLKSSCRLLTYRFTGVSTDKKKKGKK